MRWFFLDAPPASDEGAFYWVARAPPGDFGRFYDLYTPDDFGGVAAILYRPIPIFWYRPLHFLLRWPGAAVSFEGYRIMNAVITATVAPIAWGLLRAYGVRRPAALLGAAATTLVPVVVIWSTFGLADGLAVVFVLAALWLHIEARPLGSGVAWVAAAWTKEVTLIALAALLALHVARAARAGATRLYPLRLDATQTAWLAAFGAGCMPTILTLLMGGLTPGGPGDTDAAWLLDALVVSAFLWPLLVAGLVMPGAREAAAVGLVLPVWFLGYALLGQGVPAWYVVLPNVLVLVSCAAVIDRMHAAGRRRWAVAAAVLAAAVVLAHTAVPSGPFLDRLTNPASGAQEDDLRAAWRFHHDRNRELLEIDALLPPGGDWTLFIVDVYGADGLYPYAGDAHHVWVGTTWSVRFFDQVLEPWVSAMENATMTVVAKNTEPLNEALRGTYAKCLVLENNVYAAYAGSGCAGRGDELEAAYKQRLG